VSKTLPFVIEQQQETEWCWAAVSKSISDYFNPSAAWTQCSIVNAELGRSDCCSNGASSSCNRPGFLDSALQRVGNFSRKSDSPSSDSTVRNEIDTDEPLGARIQWTNGGGHFVAIYGYDDPDVARLLVAIGDPWYGDSLVAIDEFTNNYLGMGSWSHSYFTQR
jgi:Papain-like cysteine protease AvrRpt2